MMKCKDCKYFEPFNGVCVNDKSIYCADMPWQYGVDECNVENCVESEENDANIT